MKYTVLMMASNKEVFQDSFVANDPDQASYKASKRARQTVGEVRVLAVMEGEVMNLINPNIGKKTKRTEDFHLISLGRAFARKVQRRGATVRCKVYGTPRDGFGLRVTYWFN